MSNYKREDGAMSELRRAAGVLKHWEGEAWRVGWRFTTALAPLYVLRARHQMARALMYASDGVAMPTRGGVS